MPEPVKVEKVGELLSIVRPIYMALRGWLKLQASRTESPFDDWMLKVLDGLFGVEEK